MADQQTQQAGQQSTGKQAFGTVLDVASGLLAAEELQRQAGAAMSTILTEGLRVRELRRSRSVEVAGAGERLISAQHAAFAKAGVELTSGTPASMVEQTAEDAERASIREFLEGEAAFTRSRREFRGVAKAAKGTARQQGFLAAAQLIGGMFGA